MKVLMQRFAERLGDTRIIDDWDVNLLARTVVSEILTKSRGGEDDIHNLGKVVAYALDAYKEQLEAQ